VAPTRGIVGGDTACRGFPKFVRRSRKSGERDALLSGHFQAFASGWFLVDGESDNDSPLGAGIRQAGTF
jgi:hypothetical protein